MGTAFFHAICRVGIFMICAQAIVHFRPDGSYEKYLKLLVGVMVLIQLFMPIGRLLFEGGNQDATYFFEQFGKSFTEEMQEAEKNAQAADELLERMTLEEVRRRAQGAGAGENSVTQDAGQDGQGSLGRGEGKTGEKSTKDMEIRVELECVPPVEIGHENGQ